MFLLLQTIEQNFPGEENPISDQYFVLHYLFAGCKYVFTCYIPKVVAYSQVKLLHTLPASVGDRCDAQRRVDHMGKQNNIITCEILILAMWRIEQKVIIFRCRADIRDDPARPGHDAL